MTSTSEFTGAGIKGWLQLFFVLRIFYLFSLVRDTLGEVNAVNLSPLLLPLFYFELTINSILFLWTIYILVKLFDKKPRTVKLVKIYLFFEALLSIVVIVGGYFVILYTFPEMNLPFFQVLTPDTLARISFHVLACFIWYLYFSKSKRVKNTYLFVVKSN